MFFRCNDFVNYRNIRRENKNVTEVIKCQDEWVEFSSNCWSKNITVTVFISKKKTCSSSKCVVWLILNCVKLHWPAAAVLTFAVMESPTWWTHSISVAFTLICFCSAECKTAESSLLHVYLNSKHNINQSPFFMGSFFFFFVKYEV